MLADRPSKSHPEELILYGLLVIVGAIPVVIALIQRAAFGVETTLGLLMVCAGAIGAIGLAWRARKPTDRIAVHPHRTSSRSEPAEIAEREPGLRLAVAVMTLVGAVQVAIALPHPGPPSLQTWFGGACFVAGLAWLLRHRRR